MWKEEWQEVIDNCERVIADSRKVIEINSAVLRMARFEREKAKPNPQLVKDTKAEKGKNNTSN